MLNEIKLKITLPRFAFKSEGAFKSQRGCEKVNLIDKNKEIDENEFYHIAAKLIASMLYETQDTKKEPP